MEPGAPAARGSLSEPTSALVKQTCGTPEKLGAGGSAPWLMRADRRDLGASACRLLAVHRHYF